MIEAINLTKIYNGVPVVDGVSFQVGEGETLGLIGTSGCGKTTTLKMLNRLVEATSGQVLIAGIDVRDRNPEKLRQSMGYVIQNTGLFPHYTVAQNIAVVPKLLRWSESQINQRVGELLELVGLAPSQFANRYPKELSGGQQQRVGLARALAGNPPIILMDEPFGALDQITRSQIQQEFKQLESLLNKTIVIVTHDITEAVTLCDKICLMDRGKIQQFGTPKELLFQPANQFVQDFFDEQRFQVELRVTSLKDLLPWLGQIETNPLDLDRLPAYPDHTSLLTVLEQNHLKQSHLEQNQTSFADTQIVIQNSDGEKLIITTRENLLAAFYRMKA